MLIPPEQPVHGSVMRRRKAAISRLFTGAPSAVKQFVLAEGWSLVCCSAPSLQKPVPVRSSPAGWREAARIGVKQTDDRQSWSRCHHGEPTAWRDPSGLVTLRT